MVTHSTLSSSAHTHTCARTHSHTRAHTAGPATALYLNGVTAMTSAQVTVALAAQANSLRTFEKEPLVVAAPAHAGANYRVMDRIGAAYSSQVESHITLALAIRTESEREQYHGWEGVQQSNVAFFGCQSNHSIFTCKTPSFRLAPPGVCESTLSRR